MFLKYIEAFWVTYPKRGGRMHESKLDQTPFPKTSWQWQDTSRGTHWITFSQWFSAKSPPAIVSSSGLSARPPALACKRNARHARMAISCGTCFLKEIQTQHASLQCLVLHCFWRPPHLGEQNGCQEFSPADASGGITVNSSHDLRTEEAESAKLAWTWCASAAVLRFRLNTRPGKRHPYCENMWGSYLGSLERILLMQNTHLKSSEALKLYLRQDLRDLLSTPAWVTSGWAADSAHLQACT